MHRQFALLLLLSLAINLTHVSGQVRPQSQLTSERGAPGAGDKVSALPVMQLDNADKSATAPDVLPLNNTSAISHNVTKTPAANTSSKDVAMSKLHPHGPDDLMQSGAIQRAFYVLLGGTVLLLMFLGFRMYRLQRGGSKPNVMVRKYGVLANRRDVEMLPLPLDEDDEDDTVFEVNNRIENH